MALDFTPGNFNPNQPIPNGPFYWPTTFTLQSGGGNLIVGTGLEVDAFGRINATGGGGGSGTVTSVGVTSANLVVSGSPITTAGVIDIEAPIATVVSPGIVRIGTNLNVELDGTISVPVGNTTTPGVLQLNNTTTSISTSEALTAAQGKNLQDQINAISVVSNTYLGGTLNTQTGLVVEVTAAGTARGLVVGQSLPLPSSTNAGVFVYVVVPSNSYTPPGSVTPLVTYEGDTLIMSNTTWIYIPSGYEPTPATTTQAGIVRLATVPEVMAGTDNTIAVTPFGLANELNLYVRDSSFAAKGDLIAGTGSSTFAALPVGTTGQVLSADPGSLTGLRWIANAPDGVAGVTGTSPITVDNTDPTNPIVGINTASFVLDADYTAKGVILSASGASTPVALPVGTTGQVLSVDPTTATGLRWVTTAPDGVLSVTGTSPITVNNTDPANPVVGIDTATFVLDANYTTKGDILVASGAATPAALPVGTTGQVLVVDSTTATGLKWAAAPVTGITSDTFRMGQGAPAAGVGVDGEFYVSTPDYTLYNKIAGVWVNTYTPDNTHGLQSIINSLAFDATTVLSLDSLIDFYGNPFAVDAAVTTIFTGATVAITVDADHGAVEVALSGLSAPQITTLSAAFFPGANLAGDTATTHWNSAVVTASSPGVGLFNIVSNVFSQTDIQTLLSVPNTVSATNANRFTITTSSSLFTLGVETSTNQANRMLVKSANNKTWVPGPDVTSFLTAGTGISVSYNATTQSWTITNTSPGQGAPIAGSWISQATYSISTSYNAWTAINNLTLDPTDSINADSLDLNFNSTTGTWTCTEAGLYTFNGFVNWASFAGPGTTWADQSLNRVTLAFAKNQTASLGISDDNYGWNDSFPPLNSDVGQSAAGIVYLQVGDTINMLVRQFNSAASNINIEPSQNTQLGPDLSVRVTAQRVNFGASTSGGSPISITQGATVPANTSGNNGDLFLLTTPNPQVLYQKVSGAWVINPVLTNLATNASYNQNETLTLGQLADVIYDDNYGEVPALQAAILASSPTTTLDFASFKVSINLASVSGPNRATILANTGKGFGLYLNGTATTGSGDWYVDLYEVQIFATSMILNCVLQIDSFNNFVGLTGITQTATSATVVGTGPFAGGVFVNTLNAGDLLVRSSDNEGWTVGPNFPTFLQAGTGISVSYNASTFQWTVTNTGGGGGSTNPAGSNTQVQYNNNGVFGAAANFTFNSATNTLSTTNIVSTSATTVTPTSTTQLGAAVSTTGQIVGVSSWDAGTF